MKRARAPRAPRFAPKEWEDVRYDNHLWTVSQVTVNRYRGSITGNWIVRTIIYMERPRRARGRKGGRR